jgi:phage terminase large subunit
MTAEIINLGYKSRSIFAGFHKRVQRWACNICHRRVGKTYAAIMDTIDRALSLKLPNGRFHYIAPLRNQAKTVAWDYLQAFTAQVQASPPNQAELRVDLINGSRITLFGADNPDALRGQYSDGVVIDEYADIAPSVWNKIVRPMLADRGGWATIMGTIKGRNQLWELYTKVLHDPSWYTSLLRASETEAELTKLDPHWPDELAEMKRMLSEDEYAAELECDPYAAIKGAYYGKEMQQAEMEGRIYEDLPVLLHAPVHCAWDLGNGANMAIWAFQIGEKGPLIHDFIQISGYYFDDYIRELDNRGYRGLDYLPHDARVHSFETGRTRVQTLEQAGRKPCLIPKHKADDGINAAKMTLRISKFNATKCAPGLEALRQYRQEWNERTRVFRDNPEHDWASHGADAFRYLAMAWKMIRNELPPEKPRLFIPTRELTIADYVKYGNRSRDGERRL